MTIETTTSVTHMLEAKCTIQGDTLKEILAQAAAVDATIDLSHPGVTWQVVIANADQATGLIPVAVITITQDLSVGA